MEFGSFTTGLVTGIREGVEAALIVSIILAYLARTGNRRHFGPIWLGTGAAVLLSVAVGALLWITIHELQTPAEQIFEGTALLLAAAVVTWMLFWMRRTAASASAALAALAANFPAPKRQLMSGPSRAARAMAALFIVIACGGLGIAAALGVGLYRGVRLLNLRTFFSWTGVALIFVAAGLVASAVHEFIEIGWITVGASTAFDISGLLPHEGPGIGLVGQLLHVLFGYTSTPEWTTLAVWAAYLAIVLGLYLRPAKPSATSPHPVQRSAVRP